MSQVGEHFRKRARLGRSLPVVLRRVVDGATVEPEIATVTENLGIGGAFLTLEEPLVRGTEVELALTLPGQPTPVIIRAEIRWIREAADDDPRGVGLRFHALEVEQLLALDGYFEGAAAQ